MCPDLGFMKFGRIIRLAMKDILGVPYGTPRMS